MIDRYRTIPRTAVLALMIIPLNNIFPRQNDSLSRNIDVPGQSHDAGKRQAGAYRTNQGIVLFDNLRLAQVNQDNCLFGAGDGHRLKALIQDQYM
jgi:hypothetical protein